MLKKYLEPKIFLPFLLVVFPIIAYWITKPPSVLWIDSGTMIAASYTLGIPNPPGFPFYMMASHIFSILPIFNVLTRLELFSIIFSILAIYLIYRIIVLLISSDFFFAKPAKSDVALSIKNQPNKNLKYFAAFFGAIALAFSYEYWSQSQNTEAFIFTDFFLCLFLYILLLIQSKKDTFQINLKQKFSKFLFRGLFILALLYGLAAGANPTIAVLVPGVLFVMYLNRKFLNLQKIIVLGLVFSIALTVVYAYLPIRASAWPFVNWGNPQTLPLFIGQLRGEGLNVYEPQSGSINGFTGSPIIFFQSLSRFLYLLIIQFTPILLPFLFAGVYFIFKKNRLIFWFLFSVVFVDVFYAGLYFSGNQESWFILSWIICAIFIGIGFYYMVSRFSLKINQRNILFLFCFLPLLFWFAALNRSQNYYAEDYAKNLYASLKKDAILIGTGDFTNSLGLYLHEADKFRADVTPVTSNTFYVNKWYRDGLRHSSSIVVSPKLEKIIQFKAFDEYNRAMNSFIADNIDKHPIYVTHLTLRISALTATDGGQLKLDKRFKFIPHGLSLQVVKANQNITPDIKAFDYQFKSKDFPGKTPFYLERNYTAGFKNIRNDYAYGFEALGDWYLDRRENDLAFKYYKLADFWSPNNSEIIAKLGQYYGTLKNYDVARQFLEKAIKISPEDLITRFNLAKTFEFMGNIVEAKQIYEAIQQFSQDPNLVLQAKQAEEKMLGSSSNNFIGQTSTNNLTLKPYVNNLQNYSFSYPGNWTLKEQANGVTYLTNNKKDSSIINLYVFGTKISNSESFQDIIKRSPINTAGVFLAQQNVTLPGFEGIAQIWGNQKLTLQLYVLKKVNWAYVLRLDLASAQSINDFNIVLNSLNPLHN